MTKIHAISTGLVQVRRPQMEARGSNPVARLGHMLFDDEWSAWLPIHFTVHPEDELGPQLHARGIGPRDVKQVVLTHLHTDHAGGLAHVTGSRTWVARGEFQSARGIGGRLMGSRRAVGATRRRHELQPGPALGGEDRRRESESTNRA